MSGIRPFAKKGVQGGAIWLGLLATAYAIWLMHQLSLGKETPPNAAFHLVVWTLAPPIWFLFEYWALSPLEEDELRQLKYAQSLAAKFWAAVLVVILYFFPKGLLQTLINAIPEKIP